MNVIELQEILKSENIPGRYYLIGGKGIKDDKICLELFDGLWQVYRSERGKKYDLATFQEESDACQEILQRLRNKCERKRKRG